jgi:hypothetical protein
VARSGALATAGAGPRTHNSVFLNTTHTMSREICCACVPAVALSSFVPVCFAPRNAFTSRCMLLLHVIYVWLCSLAARGRVGFTPPYRPTPEHALAHALCIAAGVGACIAARRTPARPSLGPELGSAVSQPAMVRELGATLRVFCACTRAFV